MMQLFPAIILILISVFTGTKITAQETENLIIVSPHWDGIKREVEASFIKHIHDTENREIKISWLDIGGGSEIIKYISQQFQIDPSTAGIDLLFGGGTDIFHQCKKAGFFSPAGIDPELLSRIPETMLNNPLYDKELTWVSVAFAGFGIIHNKQALALLNLKEPATWEDLAAPPALNLVGIGDPRRSASAHMIIEIILQAYGWDKGWQLLRGIARNVRTFTTSSAQALKDLSVGDVAYGVVIDSYAKDAKRAAGEENIGYVIPEGLSIYNGDPVALLKGAPNRSLAEKFINFLLTDQAQKLISFKLGVSGGPANFELGKLPVVPKIYAEYSDSLSIKAFPYEMKAGFRYDPAKSAGRWNIINELTGIFMINAHDKLKQVDISLINSNEKFPVSEEEVEEIYKNKLWEKAGNKIQAVKSWEQLAEKQLVTVEDRFSIGKVFHYLPLLIVAVLLIIKCKSLIK